MSTLIDDYEVTSSQLEPGGQINIRLRMFCDSDEHLERAANWLAEHRAKRSPLVVGVVSCGTEQGGGHG